MVLTAGIEKYYFLFGLALVWIVFATVQDIRKREVANWLNFSLVAFALAYRAFYSSYSSDWMFFAYGLLGFALFFGLANLFYYSGIFAGGDAKLLMGLGAVLPFENYMDLALVGGSFIFMLFLIGAVYSLVYSVFLVRRNYLRFAVEFRKNLGNKRNLLLALLFVLAFTFFVYSLFGIDFVLLLSGVFLASFVFFLLIYAKSLEVCMIKLVSPNKLTEGDWLVDDIRLNGRVIRKAVHGLSIEDIAKLKKAGKKVLVKEGIPFVPAFLLAFLIMVFFWGVLGLDPAFFLI